MNELEFLDWIDKTLDMFKNSDSPQHLITYLKQSIEIRRNILVGGEKSK